MKSCSDVNACFHKLANENTRAWEKHKIKNQKPRDNNDKTKSSKSIEKEIRHFFVKKKTFFHIKLQCIFSTHHVDSQIKKKEKLVALFVCSCEGYIQESAMMAKA